MNFLSHINNVNINNIASAIGTSNSNNINNIASSGATSNTNNVNTNKLAEFFLQHIETFLVDKEVVEEFLQVVKSDNPVYKLIKGEKADCVKIYKYSNMILSLIDDNIIFENANMFYESVCKYIKERIEADLYIYFHDIDKYLLYNAIKNIENQNQNIDNKQKMIDYKFIVQQEYISFTQIHKSSPTPISKEMFYKLLDSPSTFSSHFKYERIDKKIIHPDTLFIFEVFAYFDKKFTPIKGKISKEAKCFCKTVEKEDMYDILMNN